MEGLLLEELLGGGADEAAEARSWPGQTRMIHIVAKRRESFGGRRLAHLPPRAGTAAEFRGGCGAMRIASRIRAKLLPHPLPGLEEVRLGGGDGLGSHC